MFKNQLFDPRCLVLSLIPSVCLAAIAYETAAGVVQTGPVTFRTEFANPTWIGAAWLLVVPVWFAGRAAPAGWRLWAALASIPQWALAVRVVQRYHQTGWSDGLENFALVGALAITAAFAAAAHAGARSRQRRLTPATGPTD